VVPHSGRHLSVTQPTAETTIGSLLGRRIRERRVAMRRTLSDVAEATGVSPGYVSAIEKGTSTPSLPVLARLALALDLSLAEVLRGSGAPGVQRGRIDDSGPGTLTPTASRMQVVRLDATAGENGESPLRLGETDVFVYAYQGECEFDVDGARYDLRAGDALHCALPRSITWRARGDGATVTMWLGADPHT
jgi:transcriptional regulator with XRE-family HTH domain